MIYFISIANSDRNAPVKIGYSSDPDQRLKTLQTASSEPLYIIACIPDGDIGCEQRLHRKFAAGRLGGEWFRGDTPGLDEFTSDVAHYEICYWDAASPAHQHVAEVVQRRTLYPLPTAEDFGHFGWDDDEILEVLQGALEERRVYDSKHRR